MVASCCPWPSVLPGVVTAEWGHLAAGKSAVPGEGVGEAGGMDQFWGRASGMAADG